jgi:hypothetical protein
MSKLGAAFLAASMLIASALPIFAAAAAEPPHRIARSAAWGCRDKGDVVDLLFLGLSASFDTKLAVALADGRCVYFAPGESVTVLEQTEHGLVRVQRDGATPAAYWTPRRNVE